MNHLLFGTYGLNGLRFHKPNSNNLRNGHRVGSGFRTGLLLTLAGRQRRQSVWLLSNCLADNFFIFVRFTGKNRDL